ncbi:hypothetical protein CBL_10240 [Carabus blaptoides fortunei]
MYSVFGARVSPNRTNIQQENNVIARKPGLSTRKPLADRKINQKQEPAAFGKAKQVQAIKPVDEDTFDFDICSYKEVSDTYNDIYVPTIFSENEINNISSFLRGNVPKTPPAKKHFCAEPELIKSVRLSNCYDSYSILDEIRQMSNKYDTLNLDDAPVPDFDEMF